MKKMSSINFPYCITMARILMIFFVGIIILIMLGGCFNDDEISLTQAPTDTEIDTEDVFGSNALNEEDEELLLTSSQSPTPAPTVTTTPTPKPTATPAPTATSAPTATPAPTATSAPAATPAPTATSAPTATPTPISIDDVQGTYNNQYAQSILSLVNAEREAAELGPLAWDANLANAASIRAKEVVIFWSHTRPNGSSWETVVQGSYGYLGENLASGQSSPQSAMNDWMNSAGHRANILHVEFTLIGVACFESGGRYYWVQIFGS